MTIELTNDELRLLQSILSVEMENTRTYCDYMPIPSAEEEDTDAVVRLYYAKRNVLIGKIFDKLFAE